MEKVSSGFVVGLITFGIGLFAVWFLSSFYISNKIQEQTILKNELNSETNKVLYATSPDGEIEVVFKGFVKAKREFLIETEIINHNTKPAVYWLEIEESPFFFLKFNGKEKDMYWSGKGGREVQLLPGESFSTQISAMFLEDFLDEKGNLQIGYYFEFEKYKYREYWSQNFQIPDEVKTQLKKQIAEQSKAPFRLKLDY